MSYEKVDVLEMVLGFQCIADIKKAEQLSSLPRIVSHVWKDYAFLPANRSIQIFEDFPRRKLQTKTPPKQAGFRCCRY